MVARKGSGTSSISGLLLGRGGQEINLTLKTGQKKKVMDFKHSLKYRTSRKINGLVFYWTAGRLLYPTGSGEGWNRWVQCAVFDTIQRCRERCHFPERAKRSASLL